MTMKKILAGVLAAASMLTVSATAFALEGGDTANITKPAEKEYDVSTSILNVELDLEIPAKFQAFLNPYGATVEIKEKVGTTAAVTSTSGVVSYAYEFVNNTKDFGVKIDATQTTTENGAAKCDTAGTTGSVKNIQMVLVCSKDTAGILTDAATLPTADKAMSSTANGAILMNTTESSQKGWGFVPALNESGATKTPGKAYAAFVGKLETKGTGATAEVLDWTDDDSLNVALVLKFNPGPATL